MSLSLLPNTDLAVSHVCLGGNVFGWTTDEPQGHAILNEFLALGGNFVDTADVYSAWAPGHVGGESENIIGSWLKANGKRADVVIATKVAKLATRPGLSRANIIAACDDSLKRLQTDRVEVLFLHQFDKRTPVEESMRALEDVVRIFKLGDNEGQPALRGTPIGVVQLEPRSPGASGSGGGMASLSGEIASSDLPTTEGALSLKLDLTQIMDGFAGNELARVGVDACRRARAGGAWSGAACLRREPARRPLGQAPRGRHRGPTWRHRQRSSDSGNEPSSPLGNALGSAKCRATCSAKVR